MGGLQFHLHFVTQKRLQRVEQVRRLHTARCVMCVSQTFPDILDTRFYGGRRERELMKVLTRKELHIGIKRVFHIGIRRELHAKIVDDRYI